MTTQTTAKKTAGAAEPSDHPTDPEQKIDSLEKRINELTAELESARQDEQKLIDQQEKLGERISSRRSALSEIENEIRSAQAELKTAERDLPAPPVDRATAEQLAQDLITAFENVDQVDNNAGSSKPVEVRATALWSAIDDAEARLLTDQIADDARPVVLAIDGVLRAAADWEASRRPDFAGAKGSDGEPLPDIRGEIFPSRSRVVHAMLQELRDVLSGNAPEGVAPETIGRLMAENVSPAQMAKMLGICHASGDGDAQTLGMICDRSLAAHGYFREVHQWRHKKAVGAYCDSDAIRIRNSQLKERRERASHLPGAVQRAGQRRPGREPRVPTEPAGQQALSDEQRHVHQMHAHHRQQAEAANQPAAEDSSVDPADYGSIMSRQMNRS